MWGVCGVMRDRRSVFINMRGVDRGSFKDKKKYYMLNDYKSQGGRGAFNRETDLAKLGSDRLKPEKEAFILKPDMRI